MVYTNRRKGQVEPTFFNLKQNKNYNDGFLFGRGFGVFQDQPREEPDSFRFGHAGKPREPDTEENKKVIYI